MSASQSYERVMTGTLTNRETEITATGNELEREYQSGGLNTRDGDAWVIRVNGKLAAIGASVGQAKAGLRGWWEDICGRT